MKKGKGWVPTTMASAEQLLFGNGEQGVHGDQVIKTNKKVRALR